MIFSLNFFPLYTLPPISPHFWSFFLFSVPQLTPGNSLLPSYSPPPYLSLCMRFAFLAPDERPFPKASRTFQPSLLSFPFFFPALDVCLPKSTSLNTLRHAFFLPSVHLVLVESHGPVSHSTFSSQLGS